MSKKENTNYVTPEFLAELDAMVDTEVPQGFFDDLTGVTVVGLPLIDVEDISDAEITPVHKSVQELRADARRQSKETRDTYLKDMRRSDKTSVPKGFDAK